MNKELGKKLQKVVETKASHKKAREDILTNIEKTKEEIESYQEKKMNSALYEYKVLKAQIRLYELIISYYKETAIIKTAEYDFKELCNTSRNPNKKLEIKLQRDIELDSLNIKKIETLMHISNLKTLIYTLLNTRFPRSTIAFIEFYKEEKNVLAALKYRKEKLVEKVETNTMLLNDLDNRDDIMILKNTK